MKDRARKLGIERNGSLQGVKVVELPLCKPLAKGPAPAA